MFNSKLEIWSVSNLRSEETYVILKREMKDQGF